jgi:hypothetical protein
VSDGIRTHDDRDHNPGLYQLSYAHHFRYLTESVCTGSGRSADKRLAPTCSELPLVMCSFLKWRARQDSNLQPSA